MNSQDEADVMVVNDIYLLRAAKALQSALEGAAKRQESRVRSRTDRAARDLDLAQQRAQRAMARGQGAKWGRTRRSILKALKWIDRASHALSSGKP